MNPYALIPLSSFVFNALLLTYVFAANPRSRASHAFVLFAGICAMWALGDYLAWSFADHPGVMYLIKSEIVFWMSAAFACVHFVFVLLRKRRNFMYYILLYATMVCIVIGLSTDLIITGYEKTTWGVTATFGKLYFCIILLLNMPTTIYGIYLMIAGHMQSRDPIVKKQLLYLSIGSIVMYCAAVFTNVIVNAFLKLPSVPALGSSLLIIQSGFIFLAVVRYNFLTIGIRGAAQELFTQMQEAVCLVDYTGKIADANESARRFFSMPADAKELKVTDVFPATVIPEKEYVNLEIEVGDAGRQRLGLLSSSSLTENGYAFGKLYIIRDVTAIRREEFERAQLEDQVRRSQSAKMESIGQLAGGIAHDFNNMLGAIAGYANMIKLRSKNGNAKIGSYATKILSASRRAADLTGKLLAFARRGSSEMQAMNLHTTIEEVVGLLHHSIDKRIAISTDLQAEYCTALGDHSQLENAFLNIGLNARDAMPNGGQLLFATTNAQLDAEQAKVIEPSGSAGFYIVLTIADTGCGMSKETCSRIFEPFFTTKEKGKGTGLGLASVYGTLQNHKGLIRVDSETARGTTFSIYLPAVDSTPEPPPDETVRLPKTTGTILLVDDEEMVLDSCVEMLKELGFSVHAFQNGNLAASFYAEHAAAIDFVILDLNMPEISGQDTLRKIRAVDAHAKVLIASGYYSRNDVEELKNGGAVHFLQKPYTLKQLSSATSKVFLAS
ncbi:MAG: response regulator [Chitinivibrionales bacterium]|nr:response regulator [Chitinivibrionales bacterium]